MMSAGVGVCAGKSKRSLIACISMRSSSVFSPLLRFQDSAFVKRDDTLTVSCKSRSTVVSILFRVSLAATVLMEMVELHIFVFLDYWILESRKIVKITKNT